MTLHLPTSKTDPFRRGIDIHVFRTNTSTCPVMAMQRYLGIREQAGALSSDHLFITNTGQVVSRHIFLFYLRKALTRAGFESKHYSGHSFRIGAATTAAAQRIESHLIMRLGRWSSDAYRVYIRTPLSTLQQAQIAMSVITTNNL